MKREKIYKALSHVGINKQGDCGPCCLGAVTGKSVKEIYKLWGQVDGFTYDRMENLLFKMGFYYENYLPAEKWASESPEWFPFGKPSHRNFIEWFDLSWKRYKSGLIGLAQVNSKGNAHNDDFTDHWVLINGLEWKSDNAVDKIVCISCPTHKEFKIPSKDFLRKYGGYNTIWVKPLT